MDIAFRPAHRLARMIRDGRVGALELLDHYLARVKRLDGDLGAVCVLDVDRARKRARAADRAAAKGEWWGPLHGVPMTVKEAFDVAGLPTTWGVPDLKDNVATTDAVAVQRLRAAGAVIFGKTNVPVMLADWQSFNPLYGTTRNPWNPERVPGGSSGGAAAALAAGLTGLEIGSDIGGSIRDPAHFCGIYGHKPTYQLCAADGLRFPRWVMGNDIDVIGPMARSATDLELALRLLAGPNDHDGVAWKVSLPKPPAKPWRQWRIAVLPDATTAPVDDAVQERVRAVADFAARQGARVSDKARPAVDLEEAHRVFIGLLRAATSRGASDEAFDRFTARARRVRPDATDYQSRMLRGVTMTHREWLALNDARHRMRLAWTTFFRDWDVLLCPAGATTAFPHNQTGERWERMVTVNGRPQPSTTQLFWAGMSGMVYLPSTVAPAGRAADGLPVGVQIVGPQWADLTCIAFAKMLEKDFGGFTPPPGCA